VIDLHLHTTASDGWLAPEDLVRVAAEAGLSTMAVTDHDTVTAVPRVQEAARLRGLDVVPGIEVTAVQDGRDVHVLGYFVDVDNRAFNSFLDGQRAHRRRRLDEIVDRLASLGVPLARPLPGESADAAVALGRPLVARALVEAGHCASWAEAFDRFLADGRPAFVPRRGASPADVVSHIHGAGGIAALAHPGKSSPPALVEAMVDAGMQAIEVFHPDHGIEDTARYLDLARRHHLVPTGGSDYHGEGSGRESFLGRVTLPPEHYAALVALRRH
jgi:predicted metal-dependent phosphoesterase TrpH